MSMSTEALFADVPRLPSPRQAKDVELSTAVRCMHFKDDGSAQRRFKSESYEEEHSRGAPAKHRREAFLNQESGEGQAHAGVRANSGAMLIL